MAKKVTLDFTTAINDQLLDKDIRDGVSAIIRTGNYLWVAGDENISIQRLEKLEDGSYGNAVSFFLKDYIELDALDEEADVEGMDYDGKYLWIVGSHSYKRKKMREESDDPDKEIERLTKVKLQANRNLLARIPVVKKPDGEITIQKEYQSPENPQELLLAGKLKSSKKWSELSKKLKKDPHVGPFMKIPGKDNGFDIEGLAAHDNKVFVGLRGPVLRGWAIILEVMLESKEDGSLVLKKNNNGDYYQKHFLNLNGMGIREMANDGKDLIVLAGPSMDLDGTMEIYRWKNGTSYGENQIVAREDLKSLIILPYVKEKHNKDKAEGMTILEDGSMLIAYDSPDDDKLIGEHAVEADIF